MTVGRKQSKTASADATKRLARLDRILPRLLRQWGVPGCAAAVTDRDQTIFARGYGLRTIGNTQPVTPETNFAICSCTKAFTAISAGIVADDGRLEWDKPIRDYYPSFRMNDTILTERLTMRDLLSHRSGVAGNDWLWYFSPVTREEMVRRLAHLPPNYELRSTYQYNNLFYMLAGYVAAQLAGKAWEEVVRERIFTPLGMSASQFATDNHPLTDNYAAGHTTARLIPVRLFKQSKRENSFAAAIGPIGPAGAVASNAADMCKWLRMHLNSGETANAGNGKTRVISGANLAEVHRPAMPMPGSWPPACFELPELQQAMGLVVAPYRGHRCLFHTGCFCGFKAMQMLLPDAGFGTVVLLNSDHSLLELVIPLMINDLVTGLEPVDWNRRWRKLARSWEKAPPLPADIPSKGTCPSHSLPEYTGSFENPAFGAITIAEDRGKLTLHMNGFTLNARHWHYDVFQTSTDKRGIHFGGFKVRFNTATSGQIDSLFIPFFLSDEIHFQRTQP
ncbi:MAG: serine hydrolase [bacterium]